MAERDEVEIDVNLLGDGPDGSAAEAMRDLAEATEEASAAEEKYQKLLARRKQLASFNRRSARELHEDGIQSGRATDLTAHQLAERTVAQRQQREEVKRIMDSYGFGPRVETAEDRRQKFEVQQQRAAERQQWKKEMGLGPKEKRQETVEEEANRLYHTGERRKQIKERMAELAGPADAEPQSMMQRLAQYAGVSGGQLGRGLRAIAPGGMGRFMGAGGGLAGLALSAHGATQILASAGNQQMTGPAWMDDFTRGRDQVSWIPGSGTFFSAKDTLSGRAKEVGASRRLKIAEDIYGQANTTQFYEQAEQSRRERSAMGGIRGTFANPYTGMANTQRETVGQEQQYKLAQRLLPLEEGRVRAARALAEASEDHTANLKGLEERERRISDLRKAFDQQNAITRSAKEGSGTYITAAAEQERIKGQLAAAEEERKGFITGQLREGVLGTAQARYQLAQSNVGISEGRLADLREREGTASGQARRLGSMGAEGRLNSMLALQMVQRYGTDNLPADVIAAASAVAPETVGKAAERSGQKFVGEFAGLAPEEFRDRLPAIRGQVDAAERQVKDDRNAADLAFKQQIEEGVKSAGLPNGKQVGTALAEAFRSMVQDMIDQAEISARLGGYIQR